jgi:hypothetical protein
VTPIEVWDLPVDGEPLQSWRAHPSFPGRLARVVRGVVHEPPARWGARARALADRVRDVYLLGGGAAAPGAVEAITSAGFRCTVAEDPIFAAARAGLSLVPGGTFCADIGQTAVKLVAHGRAWQVARPLDRAPLREEVPVENRARARRSTVGFLAEALATAEPVDGRAVLALPCEISDDGALAGCTYCWDSPDGALIGDLAREAGLSPGRVLVMNDAELAAVAADRDPRLPRAAVVLVLTLGFGVGGALLERAC